MIYNLDIKSYTMLTICVVLFLAYRLVSCLSESRGRQKYKRSGLGYSWYSSRSTNVGRVL